MHLDTLILEVVFQFQLKVVELIYDGKKSSIAVGFSCCHATNHDKILGEYLIVLPVNLFLPSLTKVRLLCE